MSRARDFADLAGSADAGGLTGRNMVINGDQRIAQRGTDLNGKKEGAYIADRYILRTYNASSVGAFDYDQVTDTVPEGFKYSSKLTVATAATDVGTYGYSVEHRIEGYNIAQLRLGRSDAKSFTISFWARSSLAGTYASSVRTTSAEYSYVTTFTLVADTWKYVSYTVPALTSSLSNLSETSSVGLIFQIAAFASQTSKETSTLNSWQSGNFTFATTQTNWMGTASNTFHFTGVQVEVGNTATPFEHRPLHDEQLRCFRFYYDSRFGSNDGAAYSPHRDAQYGHIRACIAQFPVKMRATPTVSIQSSSANSMDRYGRGQEECFPKAENIHADHFQNIVKYTSSAQTTTANWTDSGNYINRAGYKADAEL